MVEMQIEATEAAADVVAEMRKRRDGTLSVTVGTGCCESTAPFLYEDYVIGPDSDVVGNIAGVDVYAPELLRKLYAGETLVLDVDRDVIVESLSIETEVDCRLKLVLPDASSAPADL